MSVYNVYADFGDGYVDVPFLMVGPKHCQIHKGLKPTIDDCVFTTDDITIANLFNTTIDEIPVIITKDSASYFTGIARNNFSNKISATLEEFRVEVTDNLIRLKKTCNQNLQYAGYKISNPTTKAESILHQLFYEAGFEDAELDFAEIDITIDYFVVSASDKKQYWTLIEKLLSEFGYVVYCDPLDSGIAKVYDLFPATITPTYLGNPDYYQPVDIRKLEQKAKAVRVTYYPHETIEDVIVFSDTAGGDATNKCNITLAATESYPDGSDAADTYCDYQVDDYEVIVVNDAALDIDQTGVATNTFTPGYKRALLQLYSESGGSITQLDITGDAVLKDICHKNTVLKYIVADSEEIEDIEAEYITTKAHADHLAYGYAKWLEYSDFLYYFACENLTVGQYLSFVESVMSIATTIRVIDITEDDLGGQRIIAEGVEEYVVTETTAELSYSPPSVQPANQNIASLQQFVTHAEAGTSGYTAAGMVTVPTVPVISSCVGGYMHTMTAWDTQSNLSNFSHYDIQASDDCFEVSADTSITDATVTDTDTSDMTVGDGVQGLGIPSGATVSSITSGTDFELSAAATADGSDVTLIIIPAAAEWYSLLQDGTDWKDTVDEETSVPVASFVHANIPLTGDTDNPIGKQLFYRVRRVTLLSVESAWSAIASATASPIPDGSLAADSVHANNVVTGTLQTLLGAVDDLTVAYYSAGSGTLSVPEEGDIRIRLNDAIMSLEQYLGGGWSDVNKMQVGLMIGALYMGMFSGCGFMHPDASTDDLSERIPNDNFHLLTFETDYADQNGIAPDVESNVARSDVWSFAGDYSLFATYGNQGYVQYNDVFSLTEEVGYCSKLYFPISDFTTPMCYYDYRINDDNYLRFSMYYSAKMRVLLKERVGGVDLQEVYADYEISQAALEAEEHTVGCILSYTDNKIYLIFDGAVIELSLIHI